MKQSKEAIMKKVFTVFVAVATLVALAVPAMAAKGGKGKAPKATVSIESNLYSAHEVGDLIIFTIDVANNTSEDVFLEDTLTGLLGTVASGQSAAFARDYYVTAEDFDDPAGVTNTAKLLDSDGNLLAADTAETSIGAYDLCDPDGDGSFEARPDGYSVCIWKPAQPGVWTLQVTPEPPGKRPVSISLNLRDHVPGNWCPITPNEVRKWKGEPATLTFQVNIPEPGDHWPLDPGPEWHGEAICPNGGAGGDPFDVGTVGSFYLAIYDNYQIVAERSGS